MVATALPPILAASMARLTDAAVSVTGPPSVREGVRRAVAGELADGEAEALAAELDALAGLLLTR